MRFAGSKLHFDDVAADELITRFGSPLYVYERAVLERQIAKVRSSFSALPFQAAYAIKANSNLELLKIVGNAGFSFDAVSPGEVFLLRHAGFRGERVWFTCSNVSDDDLRALDDRELVVNVNGMSELDRVIRLRLPNPIALRINPDVGAGHHRDVVTGGFGVKFGFDLAEIDDALKIALDSGQRVIGLHAHIGSGVDSVEPLMQSAGTLLELSRSIPTLEVINFGGGISIPYQPAEAEFPIEEYGARLAEVAGPDLHRRNLRAMIEPGRYIMAQCGTLLACVTTKRISSGYEWLGCDTGFNHLARPSKYGAYHHIVNASRGDDEELRTGHAPSREARTVVAGNICESGDVFTRDVDGTKPRSLPPFHVGDLIAFCDAGAYGFSMASEYNARFLPAEVLVEGSEARVIRRRRGYDDLLRDFDAV